MKLMKLVCEWCGAKSDEFNEPDPYKAQDVDAMARVMSMAPAIGQLVEPVEDPWPKGWYSFGMGPVGRAGRPEFYGDLCPACFAALKKLSESRKHHHDHIAVVRPITR